MKNEAGMAYMLMDASQNNVRRYWNGHGWTADPSEGIRSNWQYWLTSDADSCFWQLVDAGCRVAIARVWFTFYDGQATVHKIKVRQISKNATSWLSEKDREDIRR